LTGREPSAGTKGPVGPGVVYSALAAASLVFVAAITLTASQPPPPSIAEFAPQAVEQIKEAPTEQSSAFGSGEGGACPPGAEGCEADEVIGGELAARPPRPVVDVARVRRCVGDPPRQIEDPQSPPCVPYWEGDNGGATYKGVTRDEIRIYVPANSARTPSLAYPLFEAFFNSRFEFYGRKLRMVLQSRDSCAEADQRADAVEAESFEVFASAHYQCHYGYWYLDELARRGIIGITSEPPSGAYLADRRPYVWSYPMDTDAIFANVGEWVCGRLAGGDAIHAGDEALRTKERSFGVVHHSVNLDEPIELGPLEDALAACGADPAVSIPHTYGDRAGATNVMLQMQERGVTSVICLCHFQGNWSNLARAATTQSYHPEWLMNTYIGGDASGAVRLIPPDQAENAFGITIEPRVLRVEDEPWYWAACEVGECLEAEAGTRAMQYRGMLLLASGIQMAGPNLTPETFEAGLQSTMFPNPDHPNLPGKVGFAGRSYSMTTDGAEIFWSATAQDPNDGSAGHYCYVDGGARHGRGSWPQGGDPFFKEPCDSGA